ncbi:1-deoxy-D-xylulose 5-phosphate reductoisomerase [Spiroplasma kunkelii CR2-3x]|uniref:1-deoxy-D-xylulose 5-phosphate reductoisomerase n=1 Tax=Spiroplasma kunkelii CR2-3x TaxID=273035 RepID=A0A0K2JH44_SPIKU|nr:1-deoxy-D-xylulose-5-phosphate reductoisomerase [Spiroplasma kunkelii]ALA97914.1 1-deoxy-D-xylulose 5-phosphate reductoisomerase [Spiroplasma kunkelii CR2-3x]
MRNIIVFGASGNIGQQALQIIESNPNDFQITAVSIYHNISVLIKILEKHSTIRIVHLGDETQQAILTAQYPNITFVTKEAGINVMLAAFPTALVLNAISGFVGLYPTLQTLYDKNRTLLLANKESLVVAGDLINNLLAKNNNKLYPIDSEHCAIFQCLDQTNPCSEIILTASGGMFANKTLADLKTIDEQQALQHPTWNMGQNITIDSSTMVNKGFEIIEAYHLFKTSKITVILHPQAILHSAVQYADFSIIGQLSKPSMLQVLNYFLYYPIRKNSSFLKPLNFEKLITLTFQKADLSRWKALQLAYRCLNENNSLAIAFNAANETLRSLFLSGRIKFYQIVDYIEYFMNQIKPQKLINYCEIKELNDIIKRDIINYFSEK